MCRRGREGAREAGSEERRRGVNERYNNTNDLYIQETEIMYTLFSIMRILVHINTT